MEERFAKHREFLVDRIDPDFGLLDKLLASKTLTRDAVHRIELKDNTTEDKNRILLDFILTNKKANELVSALRDNGQIHLVNYLNADGGYDSAFGDDWPLSESEISRLDINRESLIDILDTTDLCIRLFSQNVINNRQKQFIFSKPTDSDKNKALLDILTKCSLRQYKMTIACLNDSNQSHIADLLSEGGVIVRVHANVEGAVGNVDELEEEIITRLTEVLGNRPLEEHHRLWELTQQRIITARKGESIVIYIHCTTNDELLQLIDLLKTDKLKGIIEEVFTEMLSIRDALMVTLTWSLEEFKRASTYFEWILKKFSHNKRVLNEAEVTETNPQGIEDMDRCCCCGGVEESKDRASGHVFDCQHFLCRDCLKSFGEKRLQSVCFVCVSPAVDTAMLPFDKISSNRISKPLTDFALTLHEKKNELEATEKAFEEQGNQIRKDTEKHAQMCRLLIERDEKRLLQQLDEIMSAILSENSAAISSITSLIQRLEKADDLDHEEETDEVEQLLTTRIKTTQFKDVSVYLNDICPPNDRNFVGELKIDLMPDQSSFLESPVLVGSIPDVRHQAVTGVTSLDREIFVTCDGSQDISVHAVMSNTFVRSLSLLHLFEPIVISSPVDLAACHTTRTLYVADGGNNYVFRLRPDGKLVHWWPVENIRGLYVGSTGTVLVGSGRAIREYDPSGKLVRAISMFPLGSIFRGWERPYMKHPTHFLETDNGRIVVCDFTDDRSPHVVYAVDRKGSAVTCWHGNRADSGDEFLNEPRHLAIDATGHVMVADRRNDRVKLLDADLKFARDLMGPGQFFKRPQRLHYDPARGLLYVGLVAGDTLVFRVTL